MGHLESDIETILLPYTVQLCHWEHILRSGGSFQVYIRLIVRIGQLFYLTQCSYVTGSISFGHTRTSGEIESSVLGYLYYHMNWSCSERVCQEGVSRGCVEGVRRVCISKCVRWRIS